MPRPTIRVITPRCSLRVIYKNRVRHNTQTPTHITYLQHTQSRFVCGEAPLLLAWTLHVLIEQRSTVDHKPHPVAGGAPGPSSVV